MVKLNKEKLIIGPRVRRLRQSFGLTQTAMANDLGISVSYLNLIERNQRPMSAKVLLRLADVFDVDIAQLSPSSDIQTVRELIQVLQSPAYGDFNISKSEIEDCVSISPDLARAFLSAHQSAGSSFGGQNPEGERSGTVGSVRTFLHDNKNYFDALDRAAEALADELGLSKRRPNTSLSDRLSDKHGIRVRIVPQDILAGRAWHYDYHARRLDLSELLAQSGRRFRIAYQLARLEFKTQIDDIIAKALLPNKDADNLARLTLNNYAAGATLMPYGRFFKEVKACKYDVELLTRRFDTSYEQTAHRLTTLQKPGQRGVPFFFLRVDMAGNISKHFSAGLLHISKHGATSALWNIHTCFQMPGKTIPQVVSFADGTEYFTIARAILRPEQAHGQSPQMMSIGLGCAVKHAEELVYYTDTLNKVPTKVGVNYY